MLGLLGQIDAPPVADEFRQETNRLLVSRLRVGVILALILIPLFIPLDYLRVPGRFGAALTIRLVGSAFLLALLPLLHGESSARRAVTVAAAGLAIMSLTILGVADLAAGASDPVYLVQAMGIIFVIMGAGLLLPVDGPTLFRLGLIPFALQVLLTLGFDPLENLPVLASTLSALVIATVGGHSAWANRLAEFVARHANEELLRAREEIVGRLEQEVAAHRRTEEVVRRSEQRYRTLFEETRDAVVLAAPDGTILDVNPAGLELFGYASCDEMRSSGARSLYFQPERDQQLVRDAMATQGYLKDVEVELRQKDGRKLDAVLSATLVRDETGTVTGARVILRDVTEHKLLEAKLRQTQKLEALGLLAAGVAHEINNPLTYVLSHLETLQRDLAAGGSAGLPRDLLPSLRLRVREAAEGAERVRRIVHDLKTFSRTEEEVRMTVPLHAAIEKAISIAYQELRFRAHLVRDLAPVPAVLAEEGRLTQVLVNLLINAAQAIDEGAVDRNEIRVGTRTEAGEVRVEVADTGRGISPEHLERLFDPFFTTKPVGEGSGLGLSICYNIVTAWGGRIEVESEVGRGSRFVVCLLPAAEEPHRLAPSAAHPVARRSAPRLRILVVDDEPLVLSTARLILATEHEVVTAASGREALTLLERDPAFDLVLTDLMMRDVSGMDLHAVVSERNPRLAARMIFMTGGAFTPRAQDFLETVPNRYVEKPFNPSELLGLVANAAGRA